MLGFVAHTGTTYWERPGAVLAVVVDGRYWSVDRRACFVDGLHHFAVCAVVVDLNARGWGPGGGDSVDVFRGLVLRLFSDWLTS